MNSFETNPDGSRYSLPENKNISMNLTPGKRGNNYNNHVAEKIHTEAELIRFAAFCEKYDYSVLDRSDPDVYPKCICVPDVELLGDGDLIRIYNTTTYPMHKTCLNWKPVSKRREYRIYEDELDQLLSDLGIFNNRDMIRERFELC